MSSRYYTRKSPSTTARRSTYKRTSRASYARAAPVYRRKRTTYTPSYSRQRSSTGIVRTIGQAGGAALGGYLGGPVGSTIGSAVGRKAADLFTSITGFGDYKVNYNTIVNAEQTPLFKNKNSTRSVCVSHREYIDDVITGPTSAFKISTYDLNPADPMTYPWLATIAQNFEEYRIHGMVFHYKSNSADALNSVNTALGTVIMATQYNVLLDPFANKQQMENYEFGCSSRPSADLLHPIECDPKVTSFGPIYDIRLGGNDKGDARLYSPGKFSIATVGQQGVDVNIGELWVTYDIEFYKPRMGDVASQISQWRILAPSGSFTSGNPLTNDPSAAIISDSSDFAAVSLDILNDSIIFDSSYTGIVQILLKWYSTTTQATNMQPPTNFSVSGGGSLFRIFEGGGAACTSSPALNANSCHSIIYVNMVGGCTFLVGANGAFPGVTACDIVVTTLPNTFKLYEPDD